MHRSQSFAAVLVALLLATSGCLGVVTGGDTTFEASPSTIPDATLSETDYERTTNETRTIEENVTVLGQTQTVRVVNHVSEYYKTVSIPFLGDVDLARLTVVTTPDAQVAGQSVNPLSQFSAREVVGEFSGEAAGVRNLSHLNNRTVQVLGEDRTVEKFEGTVERNGREVEVFVHAATFEHEGDRLLMIAAYPQTLSDEQENVDELLRSVDH